MALDNKQNISVGKSFLQDSSFRHVTGSAAYIDDIPLPKNCLHGALVLSDTASGTITSLDLKDVKKLDFSSQIITAKDIPGKNDIAPIFSDEPILADKEVTTLPLTKTLGAESQKLVITAIGKEVMSFLLSYYEQLFSYDYTKRLEGKLDEIEKYAEANDDEKALVKMIVGRAHDAILEQFHLKVIY